MKSWARSAVASATAILIVLLLSGTGSPARVQLVPTSAKAFGSVPGTVTGVADAGKLEDGAPVPQCAAVEGVHWYTVTAPQRGPMLARLEAGAELETVLALYRVRGDDRFAMLCERANRAGRAELVWYGHPNGAYLIGVGRVTGSDSDTYRLTVQAAEQRPTPPGAALATGGVGSTLNPVLDREDGWSVSMASGTTYRLNLTTPWRNGCISYRIYRPGIWSFATATPVFTRECGGYSLFTPGMQGGGEYSVLVTANGEGSADHEYRLDVAAAGEDDTAPGVKLENGQYVNGSIDADAIDALDLYRFGVAREQQLTTIELTQKPDVALDLLVLAETGKKMASVTTGRGRQALRLHIPAGRYYAAVRSRGTGDGEYGLQVRVRDVTATAIDVAGVRFVEAPEAQVVPLNVHVTSASHGGHVAVDIDHYDPFAGWHFATTVGGALDANGNYVAQWLPASVGHWRARARFVANPYSSFSKSGYVRIHVIEPLE
ncbi:MAG TPA: hypothetical protein VIA10_16685 [Gaiellaceae bacterium]|jgi:hypothetical protein